jgi:hypothetical protein
MSFFDPQPPAKPQFESVQEALESTKTRRLPPRFLAYEKSYRLYEWRARFAGFVLFAAIMLMLLGLMTFISWFRP